MQAWVQFGVPMEEMGPIFEMLVSNVQVKHFQKSENVIDRQCTPKGQKWYFRMRF